MLLVLPQFQLLVPASYTLLFPVGLRVIDFWTPGCDEQFDLFQAKSNIVTHAYLLFWVVKNRSVIKQLLSRTNLISKRAHWWRLCLAVPSPACWCPCCSSWFLVACTTPRPRFKPGWMSSPFCLGFLYDPGISHFPQQTSASSRGEHRSLAPSAAASLPREPAATPGPDTRTWIRASTADTGSTAVPSATSLFALNPVLIPHTVGNHVWGAAIQRGENERLRDGQRGQPDVL